MSRAVEYILSNKEWIFSGCGLLVFSALIWLLRILFFTKGDGRRGEARNMSNSEIASVRTTERQNEVPRHWHGIMPPDSKYHFSSSEESSFPAGEQTISLEYGPRGHAYPLQMKGALVSAHIAFTCRIVNAYQAIAGADDYAMNILPPMFLTVARSVLEPATLPQLRNGRERYATDVLNKLKPLFSKHGIQLESVTIGALERVDRPTADRSNATMQGRARAANLVPNNRPEVYRPSLGDKPQP